ncbi:MAG: B12-binding domain-containing radical SAM protein [Candidatus Brocadiales bacterium]
MNILLLQLPTGKKGVHPSSYPPTGLTALAAYLRQHGHKVKVFDSNIEQATTADMVRLVQETTSTIVGITSMSVNVGLAFELADAIKSMDKKIWVIAGGVHPTVAPEHTLSNKNIDAVVIGEGELTLLELIEAIQAGSKFDEIKGIGFRRNGDCFCTPRRELIPDISKLPIPAYDLIPMEKYKVPVSVRKPFVSMVRSRGCVFKCTFCCNAKTFGPVFRCQTPERTVAEIGYLIENFGVKEIAFKDTELTLDKKLGDFCDLLIKKNFDLIWSCNGRVSNVNYPLLKRMKDAGCTAITYGIESGDEEILRNMKKPLRLGDVRKAVKMTKELGLKVVTNFMIGNPGDTKETIEKTIRLAIELDPDYVQFGFAAPLPGTELRDQAEENNWILNPSMDALRFDEVMMNATSLPTEKFRTYLDKAYRSFYFRPSYIAKRLTNPTPGEVRNSVTGLVSILKHTFKVRFAKYTA